MGKRKRKGGKRGEIKTLSGKMTNEREEAEKEKMERKWLKRGRE